MIMAGHEAVQYEPKHLLELFICALASVGLTPRISQQAVQTWLYGLSRRASRQSSCDKQTFQSTSCAALESLLTPGIYCGSLHAATLNSGALQTLHPAV